MTGTFYIGRCDKDGVIKLGYTTSTVASRFSDHGQKTDSTFTLVGAFVVDNPRQVEREVLSMFEEKRVKGKEWFRLSDDDIEVIARYLDAPVNWRDSVRAYQYKSRAVQQKLKCFRCGRESYSRNGQPKKCWLCGAEDWNIPRVCCGREIVPPPPVRGSFSRPKLICDYCQQQFKNKPRRTKKEEK